MSAILHNHRTYKITKTLSPPTPWETKFLTMVFDHGLRPWFEPQGFLLLPDRDSASRSVWSEIKGSPNTNAQQTDSPTSSRPGLRLLCQNAASNGWSIQHIDFKTAFLQGETFAPDRDVVCQLPPEAGKPWYLAARLKKPAYGMNDAPRKWWHRLDAAIQSHGTVSSKSRQMHLRVLL